MHSSKKPGINSARNWAPARNGLLVVSTVGLVYLGSYLLLGLLWNTGILDHPTQNRILRSPIISGALSLLNLSDWAETFAASGVVAFLVLLALGLGKLARIPVDRVTLRRNRAAQYVMWLGMTLLGLGWLMTEFRSRYGPTLTTPGSGCVAAAVFLHLAAMMSLTSHFAKSQPELEPDCRRAKLLSGMSPLAVFGGMFLFGTHQTQQVALPFWTLDQTATTPLQWAQHATFCVAATLVIFASAQLYRIVSKFAPQSHAQVDEISKDSGQSRMPSWLRTIKSPRMLGVGLLAAGWLATGGSQWSALALASETSGVTFPNWRPGLSSSQTWTIILALDVAYLTSAAGLVFLVRAIPAGRSARWAVGANVLHWLGLIAASFCFANVEHKEAVPFWIVASILLGMANTLATLAINRTAAPSGDLSRWSRFTSTGFVVVALVTMLPCPLVGVIQQGYSGDWQILGLMVAQFIAHQLIAINLLLSLPALHAARQSASRASKIEGQDGP